MADLHLSWTPAWISKGHCFFYSSLLCLMIPSSQPCQTGWTSSWDMKLSWWNPRRGLLISEVNFKHKVPFLQSSVWRLICSPVLREERLIAGLRPTDGGPMQGLGDWNTYWRAGPSKEKELFTHCSTAGPSLQTAIYVSSLSPHQSNLGSSALPAEQNLLKENSLLNVLSLTVLLPLWMLTTD